MDDYKLRARQKYLDQKKIKIEEDDKQKLENEKLEKEREEQLHAKLEKIRKEKEEEAKQQVFIQGQMLIIDEAISSFKTDKTDDNIMMILTIINGCIENIQSMWSNDDIKIVTNLVIAFSNEVDANNGHRVKGLDTIANVKILKEAFEQIFGLLKLQVDIQILDTDKDEEIARQLEADIHVINTDRDEEIARNLQNGLAAMPPVVAQRPRINIAVPVVPPRPNNLLDDDNDILDVEDNADVDMLDDVAGGAGRAEDDEDMAYARRLQNQINKPKKRAPKKEKPQPLSTKYQGLKCDDFINALLKEKI